MSVRQYSVSDALPWRNGGVLLLLLVLAQLERKVSLLGASAPKLSPFSLELRTITLGRILSLSERFGFRHSFSQLLKREH